MRKWNLEFELQVPRNVILARYLGILFSIFFLRWRLWHILDNSHAFNYFPTVSILFPRFQLYSHGFKYFPTASIIFSRYQIISHAIFRWRLWHILDNAPVCSLLTINRNILSLIIGWKVCALWILIQSTQSFWANN